MLKLICKLRNALARQAEANRVGVAAEASEQVSAALQRVQQMEAANRAARAVGLTRFIARNHQRRAVVALDHTRGSNANHPPVPSIASNDQRVTLTRVLHLSGDGNQNLLFFLLPVGIELVELGRQLRR